MKDIFIEAESFSQKGGWVVEQQSMPTLGSSYLMAHGMGIPVENAKTSFEAEKGTYYVWCYTRDWTAVWDVKDSAGKFNVIIDGQRLPQIMGTNGKAWSWQLAGEIKIDEGSHIIELEDLTGFNGRCDAIYLTESKNVPSSNIEDYRKRLNYKEIKTVDKQYELVVVGGGIAGICMALSALKSGVDTLLINDRPVLGGCNSSEIKVCIGGWIKKPPYEKLGDVVKLITPIYITPLQYSDKYFEDDRKLQVFELFGNPVMLNKCVTDIEKEGNKITAVICTDINTGKKIKIKAKMFADCSGDGILARLGGAETMYGKESKEKFGERLAPEAHKSIVMGHSIRWCSVNTGEYSDFPDIDWNLEFNDNNYLNCTVGDWEQETGYTRDMVNEIEYIRDYGLRAIYANWAYQKHHCKDKERFANLKLKWVSFLGGKRESYRVVGDYILTEHDLEAQTTYDDGTAGITWGIDIHFPETTNENEFGEAFRSFAYHRGIPQICNVPYRCLYSKDISNLFLGGRIISTSHIAFSAVRVMRTLGMLGEVVGMAASLCKKYDCTPRNIYNEHLSELKQLMEKGIYIPDAFECGGIGNDEKYHFKDMEWFDLKNKSTTKKDLTTADIDKFKACVRKWNLNHKNDLPDEWK